MRYKKAGVVRKRNGLQMWQFEFDYSNFAETVTEVFVRVRPQKKRSRQDTKESQAIDA